mmetsp:Transcript_6651/g.22022  ORF Transcript_6651/g.22022 Transcript_6651/m.22022 type:complete len:357 (+) Transcript_6651:487-1557(+)
MTAEIAFLGSSNAKARSARYQENSVRPILRSGSPLTSYHAKNSFSLNALDVYRCTTSLSSSLVREPLPSLSSFVKSSPISFIWSATIGSYFSLSVCSLVAASCPRSSAVGLGASGLASFPAAASGAAASGVSADSVAATSASSVVASGAASSLAATAAAASSAAAASVATAAGASSVAASSAAASGSSAAASAVTSASSAAASTAASGAAASAVSADSSGAASMAASAGLPSAVGASAGSVAASPSLAAVGRAARAVPSYCCIQLTIFPSSSNPRVVSRCVSPSEPLTAPLSEPRWLVYTCLTTTVSPSPLLNDSFLTWVVIMPAQMPPMAVIMLSNEPSPLMLACGTPQRTTLAK